MATTGVIVLRDNTTGAARTGLTVKLRRVNDSFASDYASSTELAGKPGHYQFTDVPLNIYKLWVNASEDKSWGGDSGKEWHTDKMADTFLMLDGTNSMTGNLNLGGNYINSVADPYAGSDVGDRDYNDARYVQQSAYTDNQPAKVIYVSNQFAGDVAGKHYTGIQEAVDYIASQNPSNTNYIKLGIFPHTDSVYGYQENITWIGSIKVIGLGLVKITGSQSGIGANISFTNIMFQRNNNLSFADCCMFNCIIKLTSGTSTTITLEGIKGTNNGLIVTAATQGIVSAGDNNFNGWTNKEGVTFEGTGDHVYLNYLNITDVDTANDPS